MLAGDREKLELKLDTEEEDEEVFRRPLSEGGFIPERVTMA